MSFPLGELVAGKHPRKERERRRDEQRRIEADTFASVAQEFIKRHASKRRTAGPIEQIIKRELVSRWEDRPITTITRRDVIEMVEEIGGRRPEQP